MYQSFVKEIYASFLANNFKNIQSCFTFFNKTILHYKIFEAFCLIKKESTNLDLVEKKIGSDARIHTHTATHLLQGLESLGGLLVTIQCSDACCVTK